MSSICLNLRENVQLTALLNHIMKMEGNRVQKE